MTVPVEISRRVIDATGGWSNPLDHDFVLAETSQLTVYADETELVLGVDYTVDGLNDPDGYEVVITNPGAWSPDAWVLQVEYAVAQPDDLDLGGQFGTRFENALDRLARTVQTVDDRARRAVKMPVSTPLDVDMEIEDIEDGHVPVMVRDGAKRVLRSGPSATEIAGAESAALRAEAAADAAENALIPDGSVTDEKLAAPSRAYLWGLTKVSSRYFGIVPGGSDPTTALQNLLERNDVPEQVVFMPGTYEHMQVEVSEPLHLDTSRALFRQRSSTGGMNRLWRFVAGAEGTRIKGDLRLDGNRDALVGDWTYSTFDGWVGASIECADVQIDGDLVLSNFLDYPCFLWGDDLVIAGMVRSYNNAGAVLIGPRSYMWAPGMSAKNISIGAIYTKGNIDQGAVGQYQHAVTVFSAQGLTIPGGVTMEDQGGDNGPSDWVSGLTLIECHDARIGPCSYRNPTADQKMHLPFTFPGLYRSQIASLHAFNFAGQGIEFDTMEDVQIGQVMLDGNYRATTKLPKGDDRSVSVLQASFAHYGSVSRQSMAGCRNVQIGTTLLKRQTSAGTFKTPGISWGDVKVRGMLKDGPNFMALPSTGSMVTSFANMVPEATIASLSVRGCGRRGVMFGGEGGTAQIGLLDVRDNGQDSAAATDLRVGLMIGGATAANQRIRLPAGEVTDQQDYTVAGGVSWKPGATDVNHRKVVTCFDTNRLDVGYRVKLVGVNGGSDAIGTVVDVHLDEITLEFAGAVDFAEAGHTTALSGTWTQTGNILTGIGGDAQAELGGRAAWLTDGLGNYAQVESDETANRLRCQTPFPALAPGATLSMITADLAGIPSQQYGIRAYGMVGEVFIGEGLDCRGNVLSKMNISDISKLAPGSWYYRRITVSPTLATSSIVSSLPLGHQLVQLSGNIDVALAGLSTGTLEVTDAGGATLQTVFTFSSFAKNTKLLADVPPVIQNAGNNRLMAKFNTGPSAGTITLELLYHVTKAAAIADAA